MKTIYIDIDEEITSVIDRIRKITDREIILVIPQRALVLQSIVNLKLLREQANILGRKVIIVTADQLGKHLATRAGLEVREKVGNQAILATQIEAPSPEEQKRFSARPKKFLSSEAEGSSKYMAVSVADIVRRAKSNRLYPLSRKTSGLLRGLPKTRKSPSPRERLHPFSFLKRPKKKQRKTYPRLKKRSRRPAARLSSFSTKVGLGFIGLSSLLILLIVLLILPKATATLFVEVEPLSQNVNILVKTDISEVDEAIGAVPGEVRILEKQESRIFKTSGKKTVSEKAKGEVTFYNELGVSQMLVATTRLMSQENILFRTQEQVTIPAASVSPTGEVVPGTTKAKVIADTPGPEGNIGLSDFYIVAFSEAKRQKIYAKSSESFTGGASEEVNVVSEEDVTQAQNIIKEGLIKIAEEEIRMDLGADIALADTAIETEVVEARSSKMVGEEADTFEETVKIQAKALIFSPQEVRELALNSALKVLEPNQYILDLSEKGITFRLESVDLVEKKALLNVHIEKEVAFKIPTDEVKKKIRGKSGEEALEYLKKLEHITEVQLELWPFWVKSIPNLEKKIEIDIKSTTNAPEN